MLILFIMAKILAFQTKSTHPSLVSLSANRAEDDRRDMKCRWSNRRGGQARQQQGGKTQTEPKSQSQDRGRKETRRCRGSARGDVPREREQGRASYRESSPMTDRLNRRWVGKSPLWTLSIKSSSCAVCVRACVPLCVCVIEKVRGVYSVYTVDSTPRTPCLYYVIHSTYTDLQWEHTHMHTHTH